MAQSAVPVEYNDWEERILHRMTWYDTKNSYGEASVI